MNPFTAQKLMTENVPLSHTHTHTLPTFRLFLSLSVIHSLFLLVHSPSHPFVLMPTLFPSIRHSSPHSHLLASFPLIPFLCIAIPLSLSLSLSFRLSRHPFLSFSRPRSLVSSSLPDWLNGGVITCSQLPFYWPFHRHRPFLPSQRK